MKTILHLAPRWLTILCLMCGFGAIAQPTITSFTPQSGSVGTLVTIQGTNLGSPTAFTIGGVSATIISNTGTGLVGMVMPGAATGPVSVTTALGSASGSGNFTLTTTPYPGAQQGSKLVGTGNIGAAKQGNASALSADGSTAIVGGFDDNSTVGAIWIYTRTGTTWTQQAKLVGTGNTGASKQGITVALSADGNTAAEGAYSDNNGQGAVWVFTRSGTTWTQQGNKLVGTGNLGNNASQGESVSLSADGNTLIEGGPTDNSFQGAAWVFTRSGGVWSQQAKLLGTGNTGTAALGISVCLSADGNTGIVGGYLDNNNVGAVWAFTRSGVTWSQQAKIVATGNVGPAYLGYATALSADGNTLIAGGVADNNSAGASWIFTRSGATWTQQGSKLLGTGAVGNASQGVAVAITADGNTALVGGNTDNSSQGASWVFTRTGATWTQQGTKLVGSGSVGSANQGSSSSLSANGAYAFAGGFLDNANQGAAWVFVPVSSLPVKLKSFTAAKADGKRNRIDWVTVTETPGYSFELDRSSDGNAFTPLGTVGGHGSPASYCYYDEEPLGSVSYYRLKMTEVGGGTSYSPTVAVRAGNAAGGITISPVPASQSVVLTNTDALLDGGTAVVTDMQGAVVSRFVIAATRTLDVSAWPSGIYNLWLPGGATIRLVKQ